MEIYKFIIDDESYFTLDNAVQPGNDIFYSSNVSRTSESVKNNYVKKIEEKLMVWIAISPRGMSEPYFVPINMCTLKSV